MGTKLKVGTKLMLKRGYTFLRPEREVRFDNRGLLAQLFQYSSYGNYNEKVRE